MGLDAYINLNFVKEVQLIVEDFILAVFAATAKTRWLNIEDIHVQQYAIEHVFLKLF